MRTSNSRRISCTILTLILLVACPTPFSNYASNKGFYIEVPYVHQVGNYCGPAALAMVLRYWDQPTDQYELANAFRPFPSKGLSGVQLKELAARYKFTAHSFSGNSEMILDHLREGRPLIVAMSSSRLLNLNHYVVLVGWDAEKRSWIVHDPTDGPYRRLSEKKFIDRWNKLENWTLMVLPEGGK